MTQNVTQKRMTTQKERKKKEREEEEEELEIREEGKTRDSRGSRRDLVARCDLGRGRATQVVAPRDQVAARPQPVSPAWIWRGLGLELISFFFFFFFFFSFFFFSFFLRFLPLFLHFVIFGLEIES